MAEPQRSGAVEQRGGGRGNALNDLCVFLDGVRRRTGLQSLALADEEGLLIAGAGRHTECEELSALAADRHERAAEGNSCSGARVLGRFALLGSPVMLCAPRGATAPDVVLQVQAACERILGVRRPLRRQV